MVSIGTIVGTLVLDDQLSPALKIAESNLANAGKGMRVLGNELQTAGRAIAPVSLAIAAMGGFAIKTAMDFESSFAGVRKTVDATEAEFANLSAGFRKMAQEIPVSVDELNRIGEAAGQLGIEKENILDFTRTMADLAVTTNLTSEEAASSLARIANITKMPQTEFDRLGSTIVALGNNFATTEAEIVDFGLRIAGAGEVAGATEAQILAIGSAMSSVGVQSEAGGTAVQKVLLGMTQAVATGSDSLRVFAQTAGLSADEFADAFKKDAAGAFTSFVEGLGKAGDQAFVILSKLGMEDQRLIRSFLSLANAGDLLRESIEVGTRAWQENVALAREAEQRYATFASQLKILWNQLRDVAIELGTALMPALRDAVAVVQSTLVPALRTAVDLFTELPRPIQTAALALAALGASAAPAVIGLGIAASGLSVAATGASTALGLMSKLAAGWGGAAAQAAAATTTTAQAVTGFSTSAFAATSMATKLTATVATTGAAATTAAASTGLLSGAIAFLTNPITLAVGALGLLALGIYKVATAETEMEKQAKASGAAFLERTNKLAKAYDTFISATDAQNAAVERGAAGFAEHAAQANRLQSATKVLASEVGISAEAFAREASRSDDVVEAIQKQIRARKDLGTAIREQLRDEAASAAAALQAAQARLDEVQTGRARRMEVGPGEMPVLRELTGREQLEEIARLEAEIRQLSTASEIATSSFEALGTSLKDVDLFDAGAAAENSGRKIAHAFDNAEASVKAAQARLDALSKTDLARLTKLVQSPTAELEELAKSIDMPVASLRLLQDQLNKTEKSSKKTDEALKQLFGTEATTKAASFAKALGSVENVSRLTNDAQGQLYTVMQAGISVLESTGRGASAQAEQWRKFSAATEQAKTVHAEFMKEIAEAEANVSTGAATAEQLKQRLTDARSFQDQLSLLGKKGFARQQQELQIAHRNRLAELEEQYGKEQAIALGFWEDQERITQQGEMDIAMARQRAAIDMNDQLLLETTRGRQRQMLELDIWYARELQRLEEAGFETFAEHQAQLDKLNELYRRRAADISKSFSEVLGDNMLEALKRLPEIIAQGIASGGSLEDVAEATGSLVGSAIGGAIGESIGKTLGAGSEVAGQIGEAIGAAFGALLGPMLDALIKTRAEKTVERSFYEFGGRITENLAQGIEDMAKQRFGGSRDAAKIFMLDDVIGEIGLTVETFTPLVSRLRDTFVMLASGEFTASEATTVLNDNFKQFVDFLGGDVNPQLKEIIQLSREFGIESAAIGEYVTSQLKRASGGVNQLAASFLSTWVGDFDTVGQKVLDLTDKAEGLKAQIADMSRKDHLTEKQKFQLEQWKKQLVDVRAEIKELTAEQNRQMTLADKLASGSQAQFDRIGRLTLATFNAAIASGASLVDAITDVGPALDSLQESLSYGFVASAPLQELFGLQDFIEKNREAVDAVSALNDVMNGLNNSAFLTQEAMFDLGAEAVRQFSDLQIRGLDADNAMRVMQPTLQTLWELANDFGYAVDEATQALLDQAEAAGVVGEEHRSEQEKMLIATEMMRDAVLLLAEAFGVQLTDAMQDAIDKARGVKDAVGDIPTDVNIDVDYDLGELPEFPQDFPRLPKFPGSETFARGGLVESVYKATGGLIASTESIYMDDGGLTASGARGTDTVNAWMTPGEYVMPAAQTAAIGVDVLDDMRATGSIPSASGGTTVLPVVVHGEVRTLEDVDEIVRVLVKAAPKIKGNQEGVRTELCEAFGVR